MDEMDKVISDLKLLDGSLEEILVNVNRMSMALGILLNGMEEILQVAVKEQDESRAVGMIIYMVAAFMGEAHKELGGDGNQGNEV